MTTPRTTLTTTALPARPDVLSRTLSDHAQDVAAVHDRATHTIVAYVEGDHPFEVLTLRGTGPDTVVITVGAHPDEATELAGRYLLDAFVHEPALSGFTVHLVCCDPYGACLNAGRDDARLSTYFSPQHFHRPAVTEQPALNLLLGRPEDGGPDLKGTLALQHTIDGVLDDVAARGGGRLFVFDLHRCPVGAVYATTLTPFPHLEGLLGTVAEVGGLPLARVGWATGDTLGEEIAPGVFPAPTPTAISGAATRANVQHYVHARNPQARTAVIEVPHFVSGPPPAPHPHSAFAQLVHWLRTQDEEMEALRRQLPPLSRSPFGRAYASRRQHLRDLAEIVAEREVVWEDPYMAVLRQTAALQRHAAVTAADHDVDPVRAGEPHRWALIAAGRALRPQAVPAQVAAFTHARAVTCALLGEQGLRLWPAPVLESSRA